MNRFFRSSAALVLFLAFVCCSAVHANDTQEWVQPAFVEVLDAPTQLPAGKIQQQTRRSETNARKKGNMLIWLCIILDYYYYSYYSPQFPPFPQLIFR
jgi:hypothetical protein